MSHPAAITAAFLEKILALLAPLFLAATGDDIEAARDAVRSTLASYHARTDNELRLVALTIAFGFGALDALGQATGSALSLSQVLRLRSNAVSLSRAGHQNQAVLDKLRRQDSPEPVPDPEPAESNLPASAETEDLITFARSVMQARTQPTAALSRQQRRAAEREAEKTQRQQEYQARRAAMLDPLAARQ